MYKNIYLFQHIPTGMSSYYSAANSLYCDLRTPINLISSEYIKINNVRVATLLMSRPNYLLWVYLKVIIYHYKNMLYIGTSVSADIFLDRIKNQTSTSCVLG